MTYIDIFQVTIQDYIAPASVPNFRHAWAQMPEESERVDEYGLGVRDSLEVWLYRGFRLQGMWQTILVGVANFLALSPRTKFDTYELES